ncbi:ABC transporter [Anopheles sinensis]|uniref:ABC transporter n=1 Tax=Anopheles sinensis TaxID=74873 RepID=A0A084WUY7_ANOSI|nr:ABC transporter [Anopheles sinensis]
MAHHFPPPELASRRAAGSWLASTGTEIVEVWKVLSLTTSLDPLRWKATDTTEPMADTNAKTEPVHDDGVDECSA